MNTNLSFSSVQIKQDTFPGRPSVPFFQMYGTSIHCLGAMNAQEGVTPSYMQYFFLEYTNGVTDRTNNIYVTELGILQSLHDEVKQYNPLYRTLKSIMETHPLNGPEYHIVLSDAPAHALGPRTYNAPTSIEIRGVVFGTPCVDSPKRVTVRSHDETPPNHLRFVSSKEDLYDALYYTLLQMKAGK